MQVTTSSRNDVIIRYNIAGIVMNLLLSAAKLVVGLLISSRSIMLDALNGFSDIVTSLMSILSTLFAGKRIDRTHPFGYGRMEYITSMFSSAFVLFMAGHAIYDSILDLISSDSPAPHYNMEVIILMVISVFAKVVYGSLTRKEGKRIRSTALIMSGTETLGDSVVSIGILASIAIHHFTHINMEPWMSIIISCFIIKTGVDMIRECINKLLGTKGAPELYRQVKNLVAAEPEVQNVFSLTLHNYGEELCVGSVDIEVDEEMTVTECTHLTHRIRQNAAKVDVMLNSVGIYASNISNPQKAAMWDSILDIIRKHPEILRAYAFSYDDTSKTASFLVVLAPESKNKRYSVEGLKNELKREFPEVTFTIECILDL